MSPGFPKLRNDNRLPAHRVFIGAGFMENHFHASTRKVAAGLAERGAAVRELYIPSGHSMNTWINVWNAAIKDVGAAAQ